MRRCIFIRIQLYLSHTIVECDTMWCRLLNRRTTMRCRLLQATMRCWLLDQRNIVTLLSCHPNDDTQLLKLGIVSFTHTKQRGVFSPQMKITFLFEYPVYAINRTMFFTYEWFWFQIQESHEKTRLWRLTDKELVTVICIHSAKYCAVAKLCRVNKKTKNLQRFAQVKNKQPQRIKHAV